MSAPCLFPLGACRAPVRSTHSYGFTATPIQFDSAREPQSIAYHGGARPSNPGEVRPLLLRFEGGAGFEQPDKFRKVGGGYIRHCPELESTTRPPHYDVALTGFDWWG